MNTLEENNKKYNDNKNRTDYENIHEVDNDKGELYNFNEWNIEYEISYLENNNIEVC